MIKIFKVFVVFTAIFLTANTIGATVTIEKEGVDYFVYEGSVAHHDIQERDPKLRSIIEKAGKEAEKSVAKGYGGQLPDLGGVCGLIWVQQKRILKEKYNIDWKSPQEMNPGTKFD